MKSIDLCMLLTADIGYLWVAEELVALRQLLNMRLLV